MHFPTDRTPYTTAFDGPVVVHWWERKIPYLYYNAIKRHSVTPGCPEIINETKLAHILKNIICTWQSFVDRLVGGFFKPCRQQRSYSRRELFVFYSPSAFTQNVKAYN